MAHAPYNSPDGIERTIVLQVLRDDHPERWTRAELETELPDIEPLAISDALERLKENAVIHLNGEYVWPSPCAQHLNVLGMVSV